MGNISERYEFDKDKLREKHHVESNNLLQSYAQEYAKSNELVSISDLQRAFLIGYNQAARLAEWMIAEKLITEPESDGTKRSLVFISK